MGSDSMLALVLVLALFALLLFAVMRARRDDTAHEPVLRLVRAHFAKLNPEFASIPLNSSTTGAYTDNKSVITLCLADPDTGKGYDINTIMYVALHELAHVVSTAVGHGKEFRKNFARLLRRAETLGFYDASKPIVRTYCGSSN